MIDRETAQRIKAWPFAEAAALAERCASLPDKGYVLFETGYGPSGLPHIGTFGEVARTAMVRRAFQSLSDMPTRLFAFSDDMDGLRGVPANIPNRELVAAHLGKPLTAIPDPYGRAESYGAGMNARLCAFLDTFGFDYEFVSATECYRSGRFDAALLGVLEHYDEITAVILPTLGAERRASYSPFLPICPTTGAVLQVPLAAHDIDAGTVSYRDGEGRLVEVPVTGGHCKLQWKVDWAMRWVALEVDYEMAGKDLLDSVRLSSRICRILGGAPPQGFIYELFLDEHGRKISKSLGNGLTIDEWLRYASPDSLALYNYNAPRRAKRLHFDVIPKTVDEYLVHLAKYAEQDETARLANPVWHVHGGDPPAEQVPLSFAVLLNLASVVNADEKSVLWGFVTRYAPPRARTPIPCSTVWSTTPWRITGMSSSRRSAIVRPARRKRRRSPISPRSSRRCRPGPRPRRSSTRSTRSASGTGSRSCGHGSKPCTRCCWVRARGRAWAPSSPSTAWRKRSR